jgi:hypothetical protein
MAPVNRFAQALMAGDLVKVGWPANHQDHLRQSPGERGSY